MEGNKLKDSFPGLFERKFSHIPKMANSTVAISTRSPGQEAKAGINEQLKYVVVWNGLLDEVEQSALTVLVSNGMKYDTMESGGDSDIFNNVLDPNRTSKTGISTTVWCENDTRDWFKRVLAEPATVFMDVFKQFEKETFKGPDLDPGRKKYQINSASKQSDPGSANDDELKTKTIPDLILVERTGENNVSSSGSDGNREINLAEGRALKGKGKTVTREKINFAKGARCVIELKSANAYNESTFAKLYNSEKDINVTPFIWYTEETKRVLDGEGKAAKIIIQVCAFSITYYQRNS